MAMNRNENSFGALLTIISILVIAFLLAFTVHKTVPVVSLEDGDEYYSEGCCGEDGSCEEAGECDHPSCPHVGDVD